jgi:ribosomal protein S18 acetylase RimI-like enzyme
MKFIKADKSQIDELVKMRIAYLDYDYKGLDKQVLECIKSSLPDYFQNHLNKDLYAYVAEDTEIVATALLLIIEKPANPNFITGKTGMVLNVYTKEEYRRRGIAKQLIEMLLEDAQNFKLDFVELKATKEGYDLYKKIGFKDAAPANREMKYVLE